LPLDKADESTRNRFARCSIGDPSNSISPDRAALVFSLAAA
jgi:hypothetical protein